MGHEGGRENMIPKRAMLVVVMGIFLAGCVTGRPVREGLKENLSVPAGTIEGNQFTGIRYPFRVSAPQGWKMSTEFPDFLHSFGYDKPTAFDKEVTELYLFNPVTLSSVQVDLTPADRYSVFSQQKIEWLTGTAATESFLDEVESDYGKGVKPEISPTEAVSLKGVQYAARKEATYAVKGVKREQGWVYAFTEPYQIFILYMILDKDPAGDRQAIKQIIDSFEVVSKK
jgi:hypothetical protein